MGMVSLHTLKAVTPMKAIGCTIQRVGLVSTRMTKERFTEANGKTIYGMEKA